MLSFDMSLGQKGIDVGFASNTVDKSRSSNRGVPYVLESMVVRRSGEEGLSMRQRDITDVAFLRSLTGTELDDHAYRLVMLERGNQAKLIAHLAEIDERKLYAGLGYSSLFDYYVKRLRLSRGTTFLRTQVARLCRRFPARVTDVRM